MKNTNICSTDSSEHELLQYEIKIIQGLVESRAQYRQIVKAGIAQWVSDFKKGLIEVKTVDDLRKLIELDIELQKDQL